MPFPKHLLRVKAPPIKCQGIKTKLVGFISQNIRWDERGRWVEPFLGSGVVLFNFNPQKAVASDTNKHIVNFYQQIQTGKMTSHIVREFLEKEGSTLREKGADHYYFIRSRFNRRGDPLDFLFLNRACFNGVMRFNQRGEFNVPFGHKLDRFRQAYVTKIVNQVRWVSKTMEDRDWVFRVCDWSETLRDCRESDFVYLDPPYFGRHTDYFNDWTEPEMTRLAGDCRKMQCGWALSMWNRNVFRDDKLLHSLLGDLPMRTFEHFYHVGSTEERRHAMEEALIIKPGSEVPIGAVLEHRPVAQQPLL